MEIAEQNTIPFVGMHITKSGNRLETSVYKKSTNTGLLLYYHSHVDKHYKDCLLKNKRDDSSTIMVPLPLKDQQSAKSVEKQMQILSTTFGVQIQPVFQTKKIGQILPPKEKPPPYCRQSMHDLQI